jgi:hypothetical protein
MQPWPPHPRSWIKAPAALALLLFLTATILAAPSGEAIWRDQCVRCHGEAGQGALDAYDHQLAGDQSVSQLATLIHETMPEDTEEKLPEEDAAKVAAYIYDAFYSPDAQLRNKPPRIELSRLTVRQYQNSVTDLIGSFRPAGQGGEERGLRAEFFNSRNPNAEARKLERIDEEVNFDWGQSSPDAEELDPQEFSASWRGSILAPDTGSYEFVVRTEHAARLFVNDLNMPLIDAWVQSGDNAQHRGEIQLLGGRAYSLRLEFSRAKLGVKDRKKAKEKKAEFRPNAHTSISLEWKRPNHTPEVIAARYLSTSTTPEVYVLPTRFPPDDRSVGYERGTAVSKSWDEATTEAALDVAGYITSHLEDLTGARADAADGEPKLREFCWRFAERAFRRPLTDEQRRLFVDRQFEKAPDRTTAVKRVVLLVLKSPRFLYNELESLAADQYDIASRMSFGLWDSLPDEPLLKAAANNQLAHRDQIETQLVRMLPDARTKSKLREFFFGWLKVSQPRDLSKDPAKYPDFTPEVASDLRTSLELSLDELAASSMADYRQFLLSDAIYLNGQLAKIYGAKLPEDAPFQKLEFEPEHRAGLVSHPYILARLAYPNTSSPIHRGVFLTRSVLGRVLRPPVEAVVPLAADAHAGLTTRQRVALQTEPEACQGCHNMINPLGFTLENFDAIGRYRTAEQDKPIDASGSYLTASGEVEKFSGMEDLAEFLASSEESQAAFVKQLFHHTVKQPIPAYGPTRLDTLQQKFAKNDYNIQKLLVEIVATSAIPTD